MYFKGRIGHKGVKAARTQYDAWRVIAAAAQWKNPEEVKQAHPKASVLKGSRLVFNIKANDAEHAQAKALTQKLMESTDPQDRQRMVAQARLLEAYERSRWPRRAVKLPDLLAYLVVQHGLSRADLIPLLGTASRVSEVLNGKRELSMTMVRRLRARFHVPANTWIRVAGIYRLAFALPTMSFRNCGVG